SSTMASIPSPRPRNSWRGTASPCAGSRRRLHAGQRPLRAIGDPSQHPLPPEPRHVVRENDDRPPTASRIAPSLASEPNQQESKPMATAVETPVESMPNEPEANKLFRMVIKHKGSDLHLKVGLPPAMRLAGVLRQMQLPPLSESEMERLMFPLLSARQKTILEDTGGIDYAHIVKEGDDEVRFRVNLFRQRGKLSLVA